MNLEAIKQGIRNKRTILWPGTEHSVDLRILSDDEIKKATFAARSWIEKTNSTPIDFVTLETFKGEETVQMLYLALSDAENNKPLCSTIAVFRASLTRDEISSLVLAYTEFEKEVSPNPDAMTDEEVAKLLATLKKKPEETLGSVSSIAIAKRLLRSLVSPPAS